MLGGRGGGCWGGGGVLSRGYAVSAPADRDASQLYYLYLIFSVGGRGGWGRLGVARGGGGGGGGGGDISRGYAVSAAVDRDASQLYYSYLIFSVGGRGGWGRLGVARGGFLVVVMQCLLLLTGMHHSYTTHT